MAVGRWFRERDWVRDRTVADQISGMVGDKIWGGGSSIWQLFGYEGGEWLGIKDIPMTFKEELKLEQR